MTEQRPDISTAVSLMRMALALFDQAGNTRAAAHLQHAIDVAIDAPIPRTTEEADALLETHEARRLLDRLGFAA